MGAARAATKAAAARTDLCLKYQSKAGALPCLPAGSGLCARGCRPLGGAGCLLPHCRLQRRTLQVRRFTWCAGEGGGRPGGCDVVGPSSPLVQLGYPPGSAGAGAQRSWAGSGAHALPAPCCFPGAVRSLWSTQRAECSRSFGSSSEPSRRALRGYSLVGAALDASAGRRHNTCTPTSQAPPLPCSLRSCVHKWRH